MKALVAGVRAGDVRVVVSNDATAGGIAWAKENGIATEVIDHRPFGEDRAGFEAQITHRLARHDVDLICLAGFMRVLTAGFVAHWDGRMVNIHPSLLPKYKGLHTHQRALDAGDARHGCTVHRVTAALDDGPILGQASVPVLAGDTPQTLAARVLGMEHRLYPAVVQRLLQGTTDPLHLSFEGESR